MFIGCLAFQSPESLACSKPLKAFNTPSQYPRGGEDFGRLLAPQYPSSFAHFDRPGQALPSENV